jgi:hypothetical protein
LRRHRYFYPKVGDQLPSYAALLRAILWEIEKCWDTNQCVCEWHTLCAFFWVIPRRL